VKRGKSEPKLGLGVSLYKRAMNMISRHASKSRERRKMQESVQMAGVTFVPSINSLSRSISREGSHESRLMQYATVINEKKENLKAKIYKASMSNCTFSPAINRKYH
jgi:hypothetical protein